MGKDTNKPQLTIDGVEYDVDALTDQQKVILEHVIDLERKLASSKFNMDQLQVGRDTFFNMLKQSLTQPSEQKPAEVV